LKNRAVSAKSRHKGLAPSVWDKKSHLDKTLDIAKSVALMGDPFTFATFFATVQTESLNE